MPPPPFSVMARFAPPEPLPVRVKDVLKQAEFVTVPTSLLSHSFTVLMKVVLELVVEALREITPVPLMVKVRVIGTVLLPERM